MEVYYQEEWFVITSYMLLAYYIKYASSNISKLITILFKEVWKLLIALLFRSAERLVP